ncbi:oleate hydratase [Pseudomonas sp. NW5]|uniref:oleate hydratase n=1 Tax=Pseudomonas sp. NW5 TaxID=2934934 RepID=UPI0032E4AF47
MPFNQYDALIRPLEQWLRQQGVHFEFGAQVEDIQFEDSARGRRARAIAYTQQQRPHQVHLQGDDLLLITLGSMVEGSTLGSMHTPAPAPVEPPHGAWALWQRLAERYADVLSRRSPPGCHLRSPSRPRPSLRRWSVLPATAPAPVAW